MRPSAHLIRISLRHNGFGKRDVREKNPGSIGGTGRDSSRVGTH
jgi:hypothetical protein